jgi:hypothetical protein
MAAQSRAGTITEQINELTRPSLHFASFREYDCATGARAHAAERID